MLASRIAKTWMRAIAGGMVLLVGPGSAATAPAAAQNFDAPAAAVAALVDALRTGGTEAVTRVLGPGSERLLSSGDKVADAAERQKFLSAFEEKHEIVSTAADRMTLQVGAGDWPLPIPLVLAGGRWRFDAPAGAQELVNRRIGRNEIAAIRTALASVDAQKAFFAMTGQAGSAEYAQRLLSSPGKFDGLYWQASTGQPESPLEPLVAQAREEGYPVDSSASERRPYHGYYFRILTAQGPNTPEGARSYLSNGRMTNGFGLVGWPATYGVSGIMSFIVNQDGIVFQKDLGPRTEAVASTMKTFDPDLTWAKVEVID
jgi:Protein of unknown function (DUF2950)